MSTGRTVARWARIFADGFDLSGHVRTIGPLNWEFEAPVAAALSDECQSVLIGQSMLSIDSLNAFMDNTATTGLHVIASGAGVKRNVLIALGIRAAPAQGDPAFMGEFEQVGYAAVAEMGEYTVVDIPFGAADVTAGHLAYKKPYGVLLAPKATYTGANSSAGVDDFGAATTAGGYFSYHVLSADGTLTVKVQDAATNADGSFADLSGATSGSVDASVTPKHGIVALATTSTVRRYLRYQLALGTATTCVLVAAFCRG